MLRPFLFVGIGGSGGKTLRALKQTLDRRLKQNDWNKGIPGAWQFIQVDTAYDGIEFPAPMLPLEDFIGLVGPGQNYDQMVRSLESRIPSEVERNKALAGWLAPSTAVPIATGAGQVRTLGRAVSAAGLGTLRAGLKSALDKMQAPDNMSSLEELSLILHPKSGASGQLKPPVVVVISSIAGGSGAGMFLDVTETLKSIDPNSDWLQRQTAYLYTPEVFDSIRITERAQIPMNALGAMNEIMAGLWATEASEGTDILFNASGVQVLRPKNKGALGPAGTYLVGSRNANGVNIAQGADGAGMDEVFMAVGEAIAGLVTNEVLADNYDAYFYTNVFANSGKDTTLADHTGLCRPDDVLERMPFGAIGFARITLGMDRLMDYASEGLTKEHVHTMLFPRFMPVDPLNPIPDAEHIERAVTAQRDDFVLGSKLNEKQPNDQVVNYLRGDDINSLAWDASPGAQQETGSRRKRQAQEFAMSCVPAAAQNPSATQSSDNWRTMLLQQSATLLPKFLAEQRSETEERARIWTEEIQRHLVEYTAKWISRVGLQVTAEMLKILRDDLKQIATQEMPQEAETMRGRGQDWQSAVAGRLGTGTALAVTSPEVGQALMALQIGAERLAEAQLLEYTPVLIRNVVRGAIEPLIDECEVAYKLLLEEVNPSGNGGKAKLFKEFAELKSDRSNGWVAPRYKPRQVERMLIESDSFPSEFERIEKMDLIDEDKDNWAPITQQWSMQGIPLKARDPRVKVDTKQTLVKVESPWVPDDVHARRDATLGAQKMEVRLPHSISELVERNRIWLEDKESSFGRQYRMSIADYCNGGNKSDQSERQKTFLSAFTDLIQLSSPLISINPNAVQTFHHHSNPAMTPNGTTLHLTPVPFAEQSETGQRCAEILRRLSAGSANDVKFEATSTEKDLYGFSTVKVAMSPMVFSSLIDPIANSWLTSSTNGQSVKAFWDGRRARPLTESIPLPPEIRLSMIVGWFVSTIFGERRKDESNGALGVKWEIWTPKFDWISFPHPLLPVSALDGSPIPAIMKSLSLAIVEAGKLASKEPLEPYMRLKHLGREVTASPAINLDLQDRDATHKSTLIRDWVLIGDLPEGAPVNLRFISEFNAEDLLTLDQRKDALEAEIRKFRSAYETVWDSHEGRDWRELPRSFELKDDINKALKVFLDYVGGLRSATTSRAEE